MKISELKQINIDNLEQALNLSIKKWEDLIKYKKSELIKLRNEHEIDVSEKDCPVCIYSKSVYGDYNCDYCLLQEVCRDYYRDARDYFTDVVTYNGSIKKFREASRKVLKKIKEIKKAIFK